MDKNKAEKMATAIMAKSKIKTGNVEIGPDAFKNGKFRLNMMIDLDVVDEIRRLAEEERIPYQTWINRELGKFVRSKLVDSGDSLSSIIERLERLEMNLGERSRKKSAKSA